MRPQHSCCLQSACAALGSYPRRACGLAVVHCATVGDSPRARHVRRAFELFRVVFGLHLSQRLPQRLFQRSVLTAAGAALFLAVEHNDLPVVAALLAGGVPADGGVSPDETTPLHAALRLGHLRAAVALLRAGAAVLAEDGAGRSAVDAAAELAGGRQRLAPPSSLALAGGGTEALSWGAATNFALGQAGASARANAPVGRVEALLGSRCVAVSAARFHSVAVTADGALLTWGWGRGGRTGHADVASGGAVLLPRLLALPGMRPGARVVAVAAAKHHTLACTDAGEVFAWGCNRDGRLGVPGCDTAATPRRVSSLAGRVRVVALAAANRHSVALGADGAVFTWGSNSFGQLGYGTPPGAAGSAPDGASASTAAQQPRAVELRGGALATCVSAAKRHTLVATQGGDAWQWGHTRVTPRRVALPPADGDEVEEEERHGFVRAEGARHRVVAVAAGAAASCALTATGCVLTWRSDDEALLAATLPPPLARRPCVVVAAAKRRCAAVDADGHVFEWGTAPSDAQTPGAAAQASASRRRSPSPSPSSASLGAASGLALAEAAVRAAGIPAPAVRVPGARRVVAIALAEAHAVALAAVTPPPSSPCIRVAGASAATAQPGRCHRRRAENGGELRFDMGADGSSDEEAAETCDDDNGEGGAVALPRPLPTLKELCEDALASRTAETARHAIPLLEAADALGAPRLRAHCVAFTLANLDALLAAPGGVEELCALHGSLLAELEEALLERGLGKGAPVASSASGDAVRRALRRAGAASALLQRLHRLSFEGDGAGAAGCGRAESCGADAPEAAERALLLRTLRRKLTAVEALEAKHARGVGAPLDAAQRAKLARREGLSAAVAALERGDLAAAARAEAQADAAATAARAALEEAEAAQRAVPAGRRQLRALSSSPSVPQPPSPASLPPRTPLAAAASAPPVLLSGSDAAKSTPRRSLVPPPVGLQSPSSSAPQRRGFVNLSLFLSGALDDQPAPEPPAPVPPPAAPAAPSWRAAGDAEVRSLRDIQAQQQLAASAPGRGLEFSLAASRAPVGSPQPKPTQVAVNGATAVRVPLSALLPRPAAAEPRRWDACSTASAGGGPASPSLRDIQAQQADDASKRRSASSPSPQLRGRITVTGFALPASSPTAIQPPASGSPGLSGPRDDRWYIPDAERPHATSLRDILQAEAEAAKEAAEAAAAVAAVAAAIAAEQAETQKRAHKPRRRASTGEGAGARGGGRARGSARPLPRPLPPS